MNRPRIVDNEMGGIGDMTTNYRDNYNKVNDISLSSTNSFNFTKLDDSKNIARIELNNGTKVVSNIIITIFIYYYFLIIQQQLNVEKSYEI